MYFAAVLINFISADIQNLHCKKLKFCFLNYFNVFLMDILFVLNVGAAYTKVSLGK